MPDSQYEHLQQECRGHEWRERVALRRVRRRGFTLVELLIVMAILALLAAVLLSAFGRVRQNAKRSSCQSNLRQIGLAMQQYVGDYAEIYPPQDQTPGAERTFVAALQPYIKNEQVFICPAETGKVTTVLPANTDAQDYLWRASGFSGSYSMNYLVEGLSTASVHKPEITALFVDNRTFSDAFFYAHLQFCGRHLSGINVNYADGHVKWSSLANAASNLNFRL